MVITLSEGPPQISRSRNGPLSINYLDQAQLEAKTLALLRLARSALTYVSLGIHTEERKRKSKRKPAATVMPMFLPTVPDRWKR